MVVHLGTQIEATIGVMDDSGNVIQRHPLQLRIDVLDQDAFTKAGQVILNAKAKIAADLKAEKAEKTKNN